MANRVFILQQVGATCWNFIFFFNYRLIDMFGSTCTLLENLIDNILNISICEEVKGAYKEIRTFEFIFILLLLHRVLRIFNKLHKALQSKAQDILNAISFNNIISSLKDVKR